MKAHNIAEAVEILAVAATPRWDNEKIISWVNSLAFGDYDAEGATRTSQAMVRDVPSRDWMVPRWIAMYRAIAGPRKEPTAHLDAPDEPYTTLTQHLATLRASNDPDHVAELARWDRNPKYVDAFRNIKPAKGSQRARCARCDGTGWEPCTEIIEDEPYDAVRPCGCSRGRDRKDVYARIRETNTP